MAEEKLPHTAIPTWSGFIYQGRVALFHVLKLLNEEKEEDYNLWYLQIDSIEDFSIVKYDSNNEIVPLTMHQVKAVKSDSYSTYKDDFEQLEKKKKEAAKQNSEVTAFFHLASKNLESKASIEIKHPDLKVYTYENDEEFCPLSKIDNYILQNIESLLQNEGIAESTNEDLNKNKYQILEKKISDIVVEIHSLNHQGTPIRESAFRTVIPFTEFLEVIQDETVTIQNEIYFHDRLKIDLNRYYQEFYVESNGQNWSDETKLRMNTYLFQFNALKQDDFKFFLQSIAPHKVINYSDLVGYKDTSLDQEEVKEAFFLILSEIKETNNGGEWGWICSDGKHYFPTSINNSDSEKSKKRLCEKILNSALTTNVSVPFNSDFLVTSECNVADMEAYANNISQLDDSDINIGSEERHNNITQWKKVSLIDVEKAKDKLND